MLLYLNFARVIVLQAFYNDALHSRSLLYHTNVSILEDRLPIYSVR